MTKYKNKKIFIEKINFRKFSNKMNDNIFLKTF